MKTSKNSRKRLIDQSIIIKSHPNHVLLMNRMRVNRIHTHLVSVDKKVLIVFYLSFYYFYIQLMFYA